jgi:hypothetical protein
VRLILAIDPGTTHSGWVVLRDGAPWNFGVSENGEVLENISQWPHALALEMVASYGMAVGAETFRTVWWAGRFAECYNARTGNLPAEVYRKDVKLHLCGSMKAKDSNIRQALLDRWGGKAVAVGNSKRPGPLFGVKSHAWAALAVAVTVADGLKP